ncbi:hypothetical protein Tco_0144124 [Tanacetum coccineum]
MFTLLRSFATVKDFPLLHEDKIYSKSNTRLTCAIKEILQLSSLVDSYKSTPAGVASAKKKGYGLLTLILKDLQKRRNDVKARTTLLLALLNEHQLRFNKYDNAKELWEAILKTFGGNEATKKTKKNQLKQQYGNFKAEGS